MKIITSFLVSLTCIQLYACNKNNEVTQQNDLSEFLNTDTTKMTITIGNIVFTATLYNNATAAAFKARLPLTINMTDLNGNEKYFDLPNALPANAANPGSIQNGDFMLYGSNTLVLFYKAFSTSYSYTRIGRIDNPSGLATALRSGSISVIFDVE